MTRLAASTKFLMWNVQFVLLIAHCVLLNAWRLLLTAP
jgi:hypothetical protein